jgi:lipopolysaccharide export system permease protein
MFSYISRVILSRLALTALALTLLYLGFDLGDQGRDLASSLGWERVLHASLLHLPLVVVQILPAALLIATVLALSGLRRRGELLALSSFGVAPARLCLPILAVGTVGAAVALGLDEWLVPPCEQRADLIYRSRRASALTGLRPRARWTRSDRWFLHLTPPGRLLAFQLDESFRPVRRVDADLTEGSAIRSGRARVTRFNGELGFRRREEKVVDLPGLKRLHHLRGRQPRAEALDMSSLYRRVTLLETSGQAQRVERLVLHTKLAFPLLNVVVALLVCPFALGRRRAAPMRDLAWAAGLVVGIWALLASGWVLGRTGYLSPGAGAWLPLGIGLVFGAAATIRGLRRLH